MKQPRILKTDVARSLLVEVMKKIARAERACTAARAAVFEVANYLERKP